MRSPLFSDRRPDPTAGDAPGSPPLTPGAVAVLFVALLGGAVLVGAWAGVAAAVAVRVYQTLNGEGRG